MADFQTLVSEEVKLAKGVLVIALKRAISEKGETNFMSISKADERGIFKQTLTFPHDERIVQEVVDALQSVA